ncbi:MAG: hypothetical protein M3N24_08215 [Actinomycetota bacterium]|nr:hypothetical protein [Actinomycetota bacterium]
MFKKDPTDRLYETFYGPERPPKRSEDTRRYKFYRVFSTTRGWLEAIVTLGVIAAVLVAAVFAIVQSITNPPPPREERIQNAYQTCMRNARTFEDSLYCENFLDVAFDEQFDRDQPVP